ncbi:FkbM family methyltransferase [Pedobacter arcticus]|uniref:FkbM family methyltransferase n=1 Tax=Pedobacter arcticus TaxID=752140 RepID=UPI00031760F6|nr:FkbM family methyltransferase [Pedobacter arcticus]
MLKKVNQFILNRAFDKKLIRHLDNKNIQFEINKGGHQVFFPEPVKLRPSPSSDFSVFLQVFLDEQYLPVVNFCLFNKLEIKNILDLGANVGFTSIYLHKAFKKASIYAVEPDENNFKTLKRNTSFLKKLTTINSAVWSHKTFLTPSYQEESDWGKTFLVDKNNSENKIETVTIDQLIKDYSLETIDILKIDIEGAEKPVFEGDISFLNKTKVIAIEIHEDYIEKQVITDVLLAHNFVLTEAGELIIGVNKKFL